MSPQRIVYYSEAWYLDACDEGKDALRSFSIDRILHATALTETSFDVPDAEFDDYCASAYGIYGGNELGHLSTEAWLEDAWYVLEIPYRESRELVMDAMRHSAGVQAVEPAESMHDASAQLERAAALYSLDTAG